MVTVSDSEPSFEIRPPGPEETLVVDIQGFEGPLDLLLSLAREQKVDLRQISILALAEQYLAFIAEVRNVRLEVAADYLVMAAWLAYLKSRLLLPEPPADDEPSGEELAERLTWQLRRLEAMRDAAARLMARPHVGRDIFLRGHPEDIRVIRTSVYQLEFHDLLKAYGGSRARQSKLPTLRIDRRMVFPVEQALARLGEMIGWMPDWSMLQSFLPPQIADSFGLRSATASTLVASLELARQGLIELHQGQPFGPIHLRRPPNPIDAPTETS
jgi:segregation and condensation protein A